MRDSCRPTDSMLKKFGGGSFGGRRVVGAGVSGSGSVSVGGGSGGDSGGSNGGDICWPRGGGRKVYITSSMLHDAARLLVR